MKRNLKIILYVQIVFMLICTYTFAQQDSLPQGKWLSISAKQYISYTSQLSNDTSVVYIQIVKRHDDFQVLVLEDDINVIFGCRVTDYKIQQLDYVTRYRANVYCTDRFTAIFIEHIYAEGQEKWIFTFMDRDNNASIYLCKLEIQQNE